MKRPWRWFNWVTIGCLFAAWWLGYWAGWAERSWRRPRRANAWRRF